MHRRRSTWRDNERWQARLEADHRFLTDRLSEEQVQALDQLVVQFQEDEELRLSFVVVFGSQAREETDEQSDLDIYAEANIPRQRGFGIPGSDVLIVPNGTLMGGANLGFDMSNDVIRDARVWHDDGSFRSLLIWLDEQEES
jgi:hypothetical protein